MAKLEQNICFINKYLYKYIKFDRRLSFNKLVLISKNCK